MRRASNGGGWSEVTEPHTRHHIGNRIAQRKFRKYQLLPRANASATEPSATGQKAREHKERAQRDAQNQQLAGASYEVPGPGSIHPMSDISGLAWGGMNLGFIFSKGHEHESQRGSSRMSDSRHEYRGLYPLGGSGDPASYFDGDGLESNRDSGYVTYYQSSHDNQRRGIPSKKEASQAVSTTGKPEDSEDTRTVYSVATTSAPSTVQDSIASICEDVYTRLRQNVDIPTWENVSYNLPNLIKAFAIKIGRDPSNNLNQRIMYFVHRHYQ